MKTEDYLNVNKAHWNERVSIHKKTELYDLENFKKGGIRLHNLEISELGDIKGKSVLHLQCHFGMDSLSLERLGAEVTAVDFSEEAVKAACELRDELNLKTEFILSDIYSLPDRLKRKFDIVYTSYGVLIWLPDLKKWAEVISHFLKDDGFFYIAEVHPASMIYDNNFSRGNNDSLKISYPYFRKDKPLKFEEEGTYADRKAKTVNNVTYEWTHSLSDIIMSLINAGLKIEFFHEHNFTVWQQFPEMIRDEEKYYRFDFDIPLLFSIRAAMQK
ncbi:MAG: class I SAM-dependent methyltransferase [Ignavibacteria bacterium]|nr:class I SAM-dependent methyltransferase [Ignavibacteria bacterium]